MEIESEHGPIYDAEHSSYDESTATVTTDEYELHDVVSTLYHLGFESNVPNAPVRSIKIKWSEQGLQNVPAGKRMQLERAVNKLLDHMNDVDALLHDIAEYTCD